MPKILSVGGLIFHKGLMLIVKDREDSKFWNLPKGQQDEGENPTDTCLREVWEETNVVIQGPGIKTKDLGRHKYLPKKKDLHLFKIDMPDSWICPTLKCHSTWGKHNTPEIVDYKWIKLEDYPKYFSDNLRKTMEEALK